MKKLLIICVILTQAFATKSQNLIAEASVYVCPPCGSHCDKIEHSRPGICSHCNMPLIKKGSQKTIAFYLQDGVEVLDFAGPLEVFVYAGYKVFTVSKTKDPIKSQGVLKVTPDYSIDDAPEADILAFFGGNSNTASEDTQVIKWVKSQTDIQYHFSVCTGAFILAEAGMLDGKVATTFHNALDGLENNYPEIDVRRNVRFVDNGEVITTAGISAGIDGALHLVAKLQGLNVAKRTAYYMEYDNWVPGNGLILSKDDPYKKKITANRLSEYVGIYEYKEGEINIVSNTEELSTTINGIRYPIYYEQEDLFTDINGEVIYFARDDSNNVIGYRIEERGKLFKKL